MKKQLLLVSLLLLSLAALSMQIAQAQNCEKGNTNNTDYMQREGDKRCEGVRKRSDVAGSFSLISFTIGRIETLGNPLKLEVEVPSSLKQPPNLSLFSFPKNYQLDTTALRPKGSHYQFQWSNFVLEKEGSLGIVV